MKDRLEGAEMIQEQQTTPGLGALGEGPAYGSGWEDGRFGPTRLFVENPILARWAGHRERLAYYRGHRDGRRARQMPMDGEQRA